MDQILQMLLNGNQLNLVPMSQKYNIQAKFPFDKIYLFVSSSIRKQVGTNIAGVIGYRLMRAMTMCTSNISLFRLQDANTETLTKGFPFSLKLHPPPPQKKEERQRKKKKT